MRFLSMMLLSSIHESDECRFLCEIHMDDLCGNVYCSANLHVCMGLYWNDQTVPVTTGGSSFITCAEAEAHVVDYFQDLFPQTRGQSMSRLAAQ